MRPVRRLLCSRMQRSFGTDPRQARVGNCRSRFDAAEQEALPRCLPAELNELNMEIVARDSMRPSANELVATPPSLSPDTQAARWARRRNAEGVNFLNEAVNRF